MLIKDHLYGKQLGEYTAAVFVVRDPYHSSIAEFKRQSTTLHTGTVDMKKMETGR